MSELQVTPFVPGIARGTLCHECKVTPDNILILTQQQLDLFDSRPAGIIVVDGAPFSHPMIRLFGLGIPTVIVSKEIAKNLGVGKEVLVDGTRGRILWPAELMSLPEYTPEPPSVGDAPKTTDGVQIALRASVSNLAAVERAMAKGATAIGLVRSEYLVPEDGQLPDAAFFENVLSTLCDIARPLSVTVRLPDFTADKSMPWLNSHASVMGTLGLQGTRLYDREPVRSVFHAILDAIANLAKHYQLSLLIPYIVHLEEFQHWRREIVLRHNIILPIGVMAETPAAVLVMRDWFKVADFVSIGCNDLMQCLYAADRDLPELSAYLDPYAPVLFRFFRQAAEAADANLDKVQLCGLLPQMPGVLPALLGMGFNAFSVEPMIIPHLADITTKTSLSQAQALAHDVCAAKDSHEVRERLGLPTVSEYART